MATRAVTLLRRKGVPHRIVRYDHLRKGAVFAADATGTPLHRTVKTLVVEVGAGEFILALMPGDRRLNLKSVANLLQVKRAQMAGREAAERLTGYPVGGISPFGTRQRLPVVLERTLLDHARVLVNAGRRGLMVALDPRCLVDVLGCRIADLAG
jgi:Cys-tRNA(Pro)/Cys-tRNA(Cys) deacylase